MSQKAEPLVLLRQKHTGLFGARLRIRGAWPLLQCEDRRGRDSSRLSFDNVTTPKTILRRFQVGKIEVQTLLTRAQPNDAENGDAPGVRPRRAGATAATIPIEDLNAENDE